MSADTADGSVAADAPVGSGLSARLERGFAVVSGSGRLVTGALPPAAVSSGGWRPLGRLPLLPGRWTDWLRRALMPDRFRLRLNEVSAGATVWLSDGSQPFVTWLDAAPGLPLRVVTERLLACPWSCRGGSRLVRVVPGSLRGALCVTEVPDGWCVVSTASRALPLDVAAGESLEVDCGALVAWRGERVRVSGVCGRLRLRDVVLPRLPQALRLRLEGPCRVWVQGTRLEPRPPRRQTGS